MLRLGALIGAGLCLVPITAVVIAASLQDLETLTHLANTVLWRYTYTTLILAVLVARLVGLHIAQGTRDT